MTESSSTYLPSGSPDQAIYEELHESLLALAARWLADPDEACPAAPQFDIAWDRAEAAIALADPRDVAWEAARIATIFLNVQPPSSNKVRRTIGEHVALEHAPRRRRIGHLSLV
jgi:hypothetical protein